MTNEDFADLCREISAVTRDMHVAAKQQEWESVSALEFRRRTLFARAFSEQEQLGGYVPELTPLLVSTIQDVLAMDHELVQAGRAERKELATALGRFRDGRRARALYENAGD